MVTNQLNFRCIQGLVALSLVLLAPAAAQGGEFEAPRAAAATAPDSTRHAAPPGGTRIGTYELPPEAPDPRAYRDTTLTYEEQSKLDERLRRERKTAAIDSLHLNHHVGLALHASPASERHTPSEVAEIARDCDQLVTAVAPGEWDVFLIARGFDLLNGVSFSLVWPEDWIVRGFSLNPALQVPFAMGDVSASANRPYMVVFNCVAHPDRESTVPKGVLYTTGELVVIGHLEVTAMSPGSLTIEDSANPDYGPPEVSNCWNRTQDIPIAARGRIDVGSGPGARPCAGGESRSSGGQP